MADGKRNEKNKKRAMPPESRAAEVATVAWVTSTLTTMLCLVGAVFAGALNWLAGPWPGIYLLGRMLLLGAIATGFAGLILTPAVIRMRRSKLPRAVLFTAVGICSVPLIVALALVVNR